MRETLFNYKAVTIHRATAIVCNRVMPLAKDSHLQLRPGFKPTAHEYLSFWCLSCTANFRNRPRCKGVHVCTPIRLGPGRSGPVLYHVPVVVDEIPLV